MVIALTRAVSPSIARCELTHLAREPIDVDVASRQHREYEAALRALGCTVRRLPPLPELPDAVFVEDAAVVVDEVAVITRPGAESRRPETATVAEALADSRPLRRVEAPATLDGGDVLRVGRRVWVGESERTNAEGIARLREVLAPLGYDVRGVAVHGCLHLKTAVTEVADGVLVANTAWTDPAAFDGLDIVEVDSDEPFAANALRIGDCVVFPAEHPKTRARLERRGIETRTVPASELAKAEGGVTCCSILVET